MPRPPSLLLPIDHFILTLKSLTTALLLSTFHLLSRLIHAAASRLLHATHRRSAPAPPPALRLPHDNASTLNYLYTPTSTSSRTPLPPQAAYATPPPRHPNPSPSLVIPPRVSLTESIQVWLWLTVDIAFDIPRYLLGTTSSFNFNGISDVERPETTTSSVVRDAGYPLEEHAVTTSDGYRLTMQRLPRKDASKIVFFMHGVLDTSLGWVCNGPNGSHAFTAHDSGADVWLGNCRANEGVGDKRKQSHGQHGTLGYWAYSINELGLNDVDSMLRYITDVVSAEGGDSLDDKELHIVAHSLGAASVLINLVFPGSEAEVGDGSPVRPPVGSQPASIIKQVILLAPAGFHSRAPFLALPFMHTVPPLVRLADGLASALGARAGLPAYIPSRMLRAIAFKLATDFHRVPALNELSRSLLRVLFNGDCSDWDRALQMPHYAAASMPALSVHTGAHLIQLIRRRKFELYDYGWKRLNRRRYGRDSPPDVSEGYGALAAAGIRVRLVAGAYDGVIAKDDVKRHHESMQRAGVDVTYTELDLGHLDVCFGGHEDVVRLVDAMLLCQ